MIKYRGPHLVRAGFIGAVIALLVVTAGLQPQTLLQWATSIHYRALFSEAGGIRSGDHVILSGVKIGTVDDVSLQRGDALVTFTAEARYQLGNETTAQIQTGSLLGARIVALQSAGPAQLHPADVIPVTRTSSPYSLSQAVGDLTTNTESIDTDALNRSFEALATVLDQVAPQLGPTFDNVTRISRTLNGRDEALAQLLTRAANFSHLLSERSERVNTLLLDANDLLGVLSDRQDTIVALLSNISVVSQQLSGMVADNEQQLAPALDRLNSVMAMLEANRDSLAKAIPGLAKYQITQGETVANGAYYNAFVSNLMGPSVLQPFLDYAFGFRRGVDAGQPPDNAGPRAEVPLPHNGIPGGSR